MTTSVLTAVAALAAVLLLILGVGRVARMTRFARPRAGGTGRMALLDSLVLDPRRRLLLVQCDGSRVLLLTGPTDSVVGWVPDATP